MKQNKPLQRLAAAAVVVLLTAGCTQGEAEPGTDPTPRPLQITTVKVETTTATRAVTTTDYPSDQEIGFIVKADADRGYAALNNWKGTYNATRMLWLPDNPAAGTTADADSIWLNNHEADVAIYAPYDATQPTDGTLKLAACVRPNDNTKDIWCKTIKASNANPMQAPVLEHLYTRIRFTVTRSTTYTAKATITAIELAGKEVYPTAVYSPFAATPYANDEATKKFAAAAERILPANTPTATATYDLLLIPATLTEGITLTLTVNGVPMKRTIDKTKFTGSKLEPGKVYNTSLLLKPDVLELGEVTVVKWDNSLAEVNGGQAEFEEYFTIKVVFRNGNGDEKTVRFAMGQLCYKDGKYQVSKEQCDYGYVEAGIDPNTTNSVLWDKGYYFMYGCVNPGISNSNGNTKTDDTSAGNSYYNGTADLWTVNRDPCTRLGEKWQSPTRDMYYDLGGVGTNYYNGSTKTKTQSEYFPVDENGNRLVYNTNYSSHPNWGAYTPKDGRANKTPVNGMWFGLSATAKANASSGTYNKRALFLPAAGYRYDGTTTMSYVGTDGYYRAGQQYSSSSGLNLLFGRSYVFLGSSDRSFGFPVRCVLPE